VVNGGGGGGGVGGGGGSGGDVPNTSGGGGGFGGGGGYGGQGGFGGFGGGGGGSESSLSPSLGGFGGGEGGTATTGGTFGGGGGGGAGMGGALFNMYGTATITNTTFAFNGAFGGNGGASGHNGVGGGGGDGFGGAIFNLDGSVSLTYVTLAQNTVSGGSAGGALDGGVAGLAGTADGSAIYNLAFDSTTSGAAGTASVSLVNSILGDNFGGNDLFDDPRNGTGSTSISGSTNLIQASNVTPPGLIVSSADPGLSDTTTTGGQFPNLDMFVLPLTSPARGVADTTLSGLPSVDERNVTRPSPGADLGAVQTDADLSVGLSLGSGSITEGDLVTLSLSVTNNGPSDSQNVVLTDTLTVPGSLTLISASVGGVTGTLIGNALTFDLGTLTASSTASGTVVIEAVEDGALSSTASVTSSIQGSSSGTTASVNGTIDEGTIGLTGTPSTLQVFKNTTVTVGTFTHANFSSADPVIEPATDFSVTIDWGDLTSSTGSVTEALVGTVPTYTIQGTHTYKSVGTGSYTVNVMVSEDNAATSASTTATVTPAPATVAANSSTQGFDPSQTSVTLSANVTSADATVSEGTVTFTLEDSHGNVIGTPVGGPVSGGLATVPYPVPTPLTSGGSSSADYTVLVSYTDLTPGNFVDDGKDTSGTLTVQQASVTVTVPTVTVTQSASDQSATVIADVTSTAGIVSEGTVAFTVSDSSGKQVIPPPGSSAVYFAPVYKGEAAIAVIVPGGQAIGNYTIHAVYSAPNGNFSAPPVPATGTLAVIADPPAGVSPAVAISSTPPAVSQQASVTTPATSFHTTATVLGTSVQAVNSAGSPVGPSVSLPAFEFPFPIITGVSIDGSGNVIVQLSGLFFGVFPFPIQVVFDSSGMLISFLFV
jgi:uncharacterized repeat protein (TIGR01451 family)